MQYFRREMTNYFLNGLFFPRDLLYFWYEIILEVKYEIHPGNL